MGYSNIEHLIKHPCFHCEAYNKFGRIHLPVSPSCNIHAAIVHEELISVITGQD